VYVDLLYHLYSVLTKLSGVESAFCKEHNEVCSKMGALAILKGILGIVFDPAILQATDPSDSDVFDKQDTFDTIVSATPVLATGGVTVAVEPA
jgi:hypothetical protein